MPIHGNTIRLNGKKHSIPRCFVPFMKSLESKINIIENIGIGKWNKGCNREPEVKIKSYNETTRKMKVECYSEGYKQVFYVQVQPRFREEITNFITHYYVK